MPSKGGSKTYAPRQKGKATRSMIKREVNRQISRKVEKKYYQEADISQDITQTGVILDITRVGQGSTAKQRTGNQINLTSMFHRGAIVGVDNVNYVRQVVFQWYEDSLDSLPTFPKLFEVTTTPLQPLFTIFNRQNLGKSFRVLSDKVYNVTSNSANPDVNRYRLFKINLWKGLRPVLFNGSTTEGTGKIYVAYISDSAATPHPLVNCMSSVNYTDM